MELAFLLFWLAMMLAGVLIERSGDRFGGRLVVQMGAFGSLPSAGAWLVSVGYPWVGYAFQACAVCIALIVLWRADRAILRATAPMLLLGGALIAAIWLTELATWMKASRGSVIALLVLIAVLTTAFLGWMLVSTVRLMWIDLRAKPTVNPPPSPSV